MILFPNAKVNLGLRIINRRSDGFHNIETIFCPVDLCDILEFVPSEENKNTLQITGNVPDDDPSENLVLKAWKQLRSKYKIPHVSIHLHKSIPIGAGLGGGSSDAAFMLKGLNEMFGCGCTENELMEMAGSLGSDCAFFVRNTFAIGTGRGEQLQPIDISLSEYTVLLVNPGIHISSKEAYSDVTPGVQLNSLTDLVNDPVENWKELIVNDFENGIFNKYPEIESIKSTMYKLGAVYSSMTGSGSTVFGLFTEFEEEDLTNSFRDYTISTNKFL